MPSVSPISEQRKRKLPEGSEAIDYLDDEIIKVLNLILPSFEDDISDLDETRQQSFKKEWKTELLEIKLNS